MSFGANDDALRVRVVANVGCGPVNSRSLPSAFHGWRQLRVDLDESVQPDVVADLTDLSPIPDGSVDALWASHCLEHLYIHQVPSALREFLRVLRPDGFACIIVPDLQTIAQYVASDKLHEPLYQSAAGPITPHDVLFGHGAAIAAGRTPMAHRCGFTPSMMLQNFQQVPFGEVLLRRLPASLELMAVARRSPSSSEAERNALIASLDA